MKKLILIIGIVFSVFLSQAQVKAYNVEATDNLILNGDSLRETTQITANDTILATKDYVLATAGAGNGWDSIVFQPTNGYAVWWYAGSRIDSTSVDDRYVELADSLSTWVTFSQLNDSLDALEATVATQYVYRITLPINGTLAGSAAAATDIPDGWVLAVNGGDLQIDHSLSRYAANVNVFYNTTGTQYRQLGNFNNAYSGILNAGVDDLTIESISTFYTAYALKIFIIFEL